MNRQRLIYLYGESISDFETSPFEMLEAFHVRSELQYLPLSLEEKRTLAAYDIKLLNNLGRVYEHVSKAYDFSKSNEQPGEWWWHLDLLLRGELQLNAVPIQDTVL